MIKLNTAQKKRAKQSIENLLKVVNDYDISLEKLYQVITPVFKNNQLALKMFYASAINFKINSFQIKDLIETGNETVIFKAKLNFDFRFYNSENKGYEYHKNLEQIVEIATTPTIVNNEIDINGTFKPTILFFKVLEKHCFENVI